MPIDLIRTSYYPNLGEGWYSCYFCGQKSKSKQIGFKDGHIEPCIGETLICTNEDTAVVSLVEVTTGRWCAGDAAGFITVTGTHKDDSWGANDGSVWGNYGAEMTQRGDISVISDGIMYPRSDTLEYEGRRYCRWHYDMYVKGDIARKQHQNFREVEWA